MHISVRIIIHIILGFRHAHLCTNYYPCYYGISSCTSLYEWLSLLLCVFVMHIFVWMTIHILMVFASCTSLYEWLTIFLWVCVMHISVRMTIHILMGFRHAHIFTNDYPYYFRISSCTSLYEWLSIFFMGFRHAHLCTNDYFVLNFFPMRFYKWEYLDHHGVGSQSPENRWPNSKIGS